MSSSLDYGIPKKKGGFLRKFLVILIPIVIIVGFIVGGLTVIKLNSKPKELSLIHI